MTGSLGLKAPVTMANGINLTWFPFYPELRKSGLRRLLLNRPVTVIAHYYIMQQCHCMPVSHEAASLQPSIYKASGNCCILGWHKGERKKRKERKERKEKKEKKEKKSIMVKCDVASMHPIQ